VTLPTGYGLSLEQSEEPTILKGTSEFAAVPPYDSNYKIWEILLIAFLPLILVLALSVFLT
jgi:hypothetical protein